MKQSSFNWKDKPCLEWAGATNGVGRGCGHGQRTIKRKRFYVHRLTWEKAYGPIPEGMCVCHHCDNPKCYTLEHLFLGTHKDNMKDMWAKGRQGLVQAKGEAQWCSKLTEAQVLEIRAKYIKKYGMATRLGKEYGVTYRNILSIVNRESWKHI